MKFHHAEPPAATAECFRRPMQERGARRIASILDAAAELIGEAGLGALTTQALAERAESSKGSLYHFFPDIGSVVRALAERHVHAIKATLAERMEDVTIEWATLSTPELVSHFLAPLEYLHDHPDLLAIIRATAVVDRPAQNLEPFRRFAEFLLARREPAIGDAERLVRAAAMVAMVDGVVGYVARCGDVGFTPMRDELACALVAYLDSAARRAA